MRNLRFSHPTRTNLLAAALVIAAFIASGGLGVAAGGLLQFATRLGLPPWSVVFIPVACLAVLMAGFLQYDWVVLACFCLIGFVRVEPAPFDLLLILILVIGLVNGRLWAPTAKFGIGVQLGLGLFLIVNLLSMFAVISVSDSYRFLGITIYMLVIFIFVRMYAAQPGKSKFILAGFFVSMAVNALLVLLGMAGVSFSSAAIGWSVRGMGFFKDPNVFGAAAVAAGLWIIDRVLQPNQPRNRVVMLVILAIFINTAAFLSLSRAVWINLILGLCIYIGLLVSYKPQTAGFLVALALALAAVFAISLFYFHLADFSLQHLSLQEYDLWRFSNQADGIIAGITHLFGIGPAGWPNAHSLYVKTLAEQGVPGFIALCLVIGAVVFPLTRCALRRPMNVGGITAQILLAIIIGQLVNSFVIDSIHWRHLWLFLGLAWAYPQFSQRIPGRRDG